MFCAISAPLCGLPTVNCSGLPGSGVPVLVRGSRSRFAVRGSGFSVPASRPGPTLSSRNRASSIRSALLARHAIAAIRRPPILPTFAETTDANEPRTSEHREPRTRTRTSNKNLVPGTWTWEPLSDVPALLGAPKSRPTLTKSSSRFKDDGVSCAYASWVLDLTANTTFVSQHRVLRRCRRRNIRRAAVALSRRATQRHQG